LNGDLAPFDWAPKQILIRCNYCSKPMNPVLGETQKGRVGAVVILTVRSTDAG
jgi:hypothetical protein